MKDFTRSFTATYTPVGNMSFFAEKRVKDRFLMSKIEIEKVQQAIWHDKTTGYHWLGADRINGRTTALLNVDLLLYYFCNTCDAAYLLGELQRLIIDWCDLALTPDDI